MPLTRFPEITGIAWTDISIFSTLLGDFTDTGRPETIDRLIKTKSNTSIYLFRCFQALWRVIPRLFRLHHARSVCGVSHLPLQPGRDKGTKRLGECGLAQPHFSVFCLISPHVCHSLACIRRIDTKLLKQMILSSCSSYKNSFHLFILHAMRGWRFMMTFHFFHS